MADHITDGKPCWCKPRAIRDGESIVWVHNDINIEALRKSLLDGQALLEWVIKLDAGALESLQESALKELAKIDADRVELRSELSAVKAENLAMREAIQSCENDGGCRAFAAITPPKPSECHIDHVHGGGDCPRKPKPTSEKPLCANCGASKMYHATYDLSCDKDRDKRWAPEAGT